MVQATVAIQKNRLALIGLGGNLPSTLGEPIQTILTSLAYIQAKLGPIVSISRFYRTPAYPKSSGPDFVNAAVAVATVLCPDEILFNLHEVEAEAGRVREIRWGARTLDLDLLALGDVVLPDAMTQRDWMALPPRQQGRQTPHCLILPHPRLQDRGFVLIPLAEICSGWRHPVTGLSVGEMAQALSDDDKAAICPV